MISLNAKDNVKLRSDLGTQPKWVIDDVWYKADDFDYEGLSESIATDILKKSNIDRFAEYDPEIIQYSGFLLRKDKNIIKNLKAELFPRTQTVTGCKSKNFLNDEESLIPASIILQKILLTNKDESDTEKVIHDFVMNIKNITGLSDFDKYLTKLLEFDRVILNQDRNLGNICVIQNQDDTYAYAPIFDNGRAFALADFLRRPGMTTEQIVTLVNRMHTSPFGNFDEQTRIAEDLSGGKQLKLYYTAEDLDHSLSRCSGIYSDEILNRARKIFEFQMQVHREYFYNDKQIPLERFEKAIHKALDLYHDISIEKDNETLKIVADKFPYIEFQMDRFEKVTVMDLSKNIEIDLNDIVIGDSELYSLYRGITFAIQSEKTVENRNRYHEEKQELE